MKTSREFSPPQTGGRTYSEGLSLGRDQVDLDNAVIHLSGELKTEASAQPAPLTTLACQALRALDGGATVDDSLPVSQSRESPQTHWKRQAGVADDAQEGWWPYFPIIQLRHVFCTRLSWVAPDTAVQRAMRYASPEASNATNWLWSSRFDKIGNEPTGGSIGPAKYYTFMTLRLPPKNEKPTRRVSE